MDGGSGSFVSPDGLMITNHHVGLGCIQNVSTAEQDFVKTGISADSREKELPCPGYEVNVLTRIEDVSATVLGTVKPEMSDAQAREARKAASARIENECKARSGLRCNVVSLYQGGEYHLYEYRKYTDVRLVFAPEREIAFFGGDPDNFTFPRHDVDICLMRAYEGGQPVKPAAYLRWTGKGVGEGDLVFVSGHPGSTSRLETMARFAYYREKMFPFRLEQLARRIGALRAYAAKGEEQQRRALDVIFSYENSQKAYLGFAAALDDASAMARKAEDERALREKVAADPALASATGDPWATIAAVQQKLAPRAMEARLVGFAGSRLLGIAGEIVEYVVEVKKPNEKRYEEYVDANLDSLRNELLSPAPVYADLEEVMLAEQLQLALEKLGPDHPFVKVALQGLTPAEAARAAIAGTKLADPALRRAQLQGGERLSQVRDSMTASTALDPMGRESGGSGGRVDAPTTRAMERIAQARWKVYGRTLSPDATFTLRLSYGTVKAFPAEGTIVAPFTTYYGLFDRSFSHGGKSPWNLPSRWRTGRRRFRWRHRSILAPEAVVEVPRRGRELADRAPSLERRDPQLERRVCREQGAEARHARDLERRQLAVLRVHSPLARQQPTQRRDHAVAAGQAGAARVGAELPAPREPGCDHRAQQPEHDLCREEGQLPGDRPRGTKSRAPARRARTGHRARSRPRRARGRARRRSRRPGSGSS